MDCRQRLQDHDRPDRLPGRDAAIGASSGSLIAAYRMTPEGRQFPSPQPPLGLGRPESRQTQRVAPWVEAARAGLRHVSLPPLDVSVSSRKMSCILTASLPLATGVAFCHAAGSGGECLAARALWQTDNSHLYAPAAERQTSTRPGGNGNCAARTHLAGLCFLLAMRA
jgi:hypothetical protein